ncbi:Polysaccharide biosynthesis/export protein [Candidatus Brocadiaceae bacterium S225]|nr:Polysaccharide biosynthesis/export protein [Candidatus Brocadiaceae bacterium S225]
MFSGCTLNKNSGLQTANIMKMNIPDTDNTYILGVGDKISVKFYYNEKLNDDVVIRSDGKITLQLIDDIKIAGLSTMQVDELLTSRFADIIESPELSVIVKEAVSQKIYVGGEVVTPTLIPIRGQLRILDTVILAGGTKESAKLDSIILLRNNSSGEPEIYSVNLKEIINGNIPDINLRSQDVVYVPKSTLAKVEFYKEHLYGFIPRNVQVNLQYDLRPSANDVKTFNPGSP